ncbi:hypothetical protein H5410_013798 [Solanum commersonii]|uniref:Uncharacterized protein n=1 Tax=Solanum commersonii TaxID=4109 RepID=A0A9J5ZP78_SOLCO|nr:hypothetical protein H5410_013798 [Solanum commersonii]
MKKKQILHLNLLCFFSISEFVLTVLVKWVVVIRSIIKQEGIDCNSRDCLVNWVRLALQGSCSDKFSGVSELIFLKGSKFGGEI